MRRMTTPRRTPLPIHRTVASAGWRGRPRTAIAARPQPPRRAPRTQAGAGGSFGRAVAFGALTGLVLAAAITVLGGVLLITAGLIAVAGLGGWAIAVAVRAGGLEQSRRRGDARWLSGSRPLRRGRATRTVAVRPVRRWRARPGRLPRGDVRVPRPAPVRCSRSPPPWLAAAVSALEFPAADRSGSRAGRRPRGRMVGRPQDASPVAAPVVPPLQRDVVDRRGRWRPARRVPRRVHQPRPSGVRVRAHDRDEPEPPAARDRPCALRAVLQRCAGGRRPRGPCDHVARQSGIGRFPSASRVPAR